MNRIKEIIFGILHRHSATKTPYVKARNDWHIALSIFIISILVSSIGHLGLYKLLLPVQESDIVSRGLRVRGDSIKQIAATTRAKNATFTALLTAPPTISDPAK